MRSVQLVLCTRLQRENAASPDHDRDARDTLSDTSVNNKSPVEYVMFKKIWIQSGPLQNFPGQSDHISAHLYFFSLLKLPLIVSYSSINNSVT